MGALSGAKVVGKCKGHIGSYFGFIKGTLLTFVTYKLKIGAKILPLL